MTRPDDTPDRPDEEGRDDLTWTGGDADDAPGTAAVPEYGAAEPAAQPGRGSDAGTGRAAEHGPQAGGEPDADGPGSAAVESAAADEPGFAAGAPAAADEAAAAAGEPAPDTADESAADDDAPGSVAPPGEAPSRGGPRRSGGLLDTLRRRLGGD